MKYVYAEAAVKAALFLAAISAALILLGMILFLVKESIPFLSQKSLYDFLSGTAWKPKEGTYGAFVFILGSLLVTLCSVMLAVPLGLACAVFLSEVAPKWMRDVTRPAIELLAGIPSIVYGLFALVVLVSIIQFDIGRVLTGEPYPTGRGLFAASVILAIMILPIIISVSQDALQSVPKCYKEASYALGSTKWQTIRRVVVPSAMPGIAAGIILGIGRAIGETMAIVLVLGNVLMIPTSLFGPQSRGEALTSAIMLEMPYASVGSIHYSALFMLGLTLFVIVFILSILSEHLTSRKVRG